MIQETIASKQKGWIGIVSGRVRHAQRSSGRDIVNGGGKKVAVFIVAALNLIGGVMIEL